MEISQTTIPETQLDSPEVQLGDQGYNTPRPTAYTSDPVPSSPTRFFNPRSTEMNQNQPIIPTKKPRPTQGPDGGYKVSYFGTPKTPQEAISNAIRTVGEAISLADNQEQQTTLINMIAIMQDFINGRPIQRAVDNLTSIAQTLDKTAKFMKTPTKNPTPSRSSRESPPGGAPPNLEKSAWNPSNQLFRDIAARQTHPQSTQDTPKTSPPKTTRRQRRLILTHIPGSSPFTLDNPLLARNEINRAIGKVIVATVSLSQRGNFILTTTQDFAASDLLPYQDKIREIIHFKNAQVDDEWSKVVIHGIPLKIPGIVGLDSPEAQPINMNSPQGLKLIKDEVLTFNKHLNVDVVDDIYWLTSAAKRVDAHKASVILTLRNPEQAQKVLRQGLTILGMRPRTEKLYSAPTNFQCHNCQGFRHFPEHCKQATRCAICAEEHHTRLHRCTECDTTGKICSHSNLECTNCGGMHMATDKKCEKRPILQPSTQ